MLSKRLDELDLLRGLSVIGMILVITPGAWGVNYDWLNHADWHGVAIADMIAPAFMFCVGFAIPLSLNNNVARGHSALHITMKIIRRGTLLILLGLFIHWTEKFDLTTLRIPGVLQRIGLTFIAVSLLAYYSGRTSKGVFELNLRVLALIAVGILLGTWIWFYLVPVPGHGGQPFSSDGSWASYLDKMVFGIDHMWEWGRTDGIVTYDPDGLFCSLTTCVNVLIGTIIGALYQKNSHHYKHIKLVGSGLLLVALSFLISPFCPINKKIWTSSFVLLSSGVSVLCFVALAYLKRFSLFQKLAHPIYCFGANALLAFTVSWLGLFWYLNIPLINGESLRSLIFNLLNSFIPSEALSSLLFGALFLSLIYGLLAWMHSKRWYWRL